MSLRFRCAVLASLSFLPITLGAQESPSQTFAEEIEVRVVDIDVVVTDARGRPITGLTREDFELLEDGKPVQIRYFTAVSGGSLAEPAVAEPETVRATARPENDSASVTWVVFIDQTSMSPGPRKHALVSLRNFLETSLAPGDRGVVASNDGLALRIRQNVTSERHLLMDALTKLQKERVHQGPWTLRASQIRHDIRSAVKETANTGLFISGDVANAEYFAEHLGTQISMIMDEEAQRTRNAIRSMDALVDALADVDGRLALVYVGAGFNTFPALELVEIWRAKYPEKMGAPSAPDPEHHKQALSERTGGLYFTINPGLTRQLAAVRSDLDHYYSLGYVPTGTPGNARRIQVRVKADGARVRHRAIVRERTRPEEAGRAAVASLLQPPTKTVARKTESPAAPAAFFRGESPRRAGRSLAAAARWLEHGSLTAVRSETRIADVRAQGLGVPGGLHSAFRTRRAGRHDLASGEPRAVPGDPERGSPDLAGPVRELRLERRSLAASCAQGDPDQDQGNEADGDGRGSQLAHSLRDHGAGSEAGAAVFSGEMKKRSRNAERQESVSCGAAGS